MKIRKDFFPDELAEALYKAAGRHEDEKKPGIEDALYTLMACAENEYNREFLDLWELLQDVAADQERRRYSVIIDVAGGLVQNVYSDAPAVVEVFDEDAEEFNEDAALALAACEAVYKKIW